MKILLYCQYVLGMGHLSRSLAVAQALAPHQVLFVLGGPPVAAHIPANVTPLRLPAIEMDADFKQAYVPGDEEALEDRKARRRTDLCAAAAEFDPDVALIELYPFGRRAFEFELVPLLEQLRRDRRRVVVSACRDILVEKADPVKYAGRVNARLGQFFDAVLVHGDARLVRLEETFPAQVAVPVHYTGYVAPVIPLARREALRKRYGVGPDDALILASAGGGRVGFELLEATLAAFACLPKERRACLRMFSGPFCPAEVFERLRNLAAGQPGVVLERFTPDFHEELAACDLSVSLAGYNTVMGVLSAKCRALVLPFTQNQEQSMRASRLQAAGLLDVLRPEELACGPLAHKISVMLSGGSPKYADLDLNGAQGAAQAILRLLDTEKY